MITMSKFGSLGRLGNQLFQLSSLIGIAKNNNQKLVLPPWKYSNYFDLEYPEGTAENPKQIREQAFHYTPYDLPEGNFDLHGYFQSYKYFTEKLRFKDYQFKPKTIAIHIRRGDYVGNINYYQLPISYYITALQTIENWREHQIIIFSDDHSYCRVHFGDVTYSAGNEIEDLKLMSECEHHILSNSSYSWWGAYLCENPGKIIYPSKYYDGPLLRHDMKDYWPDWTEHDVETKIDLRDCTFTIPVSYDHPDRKENLDLTVSILQKYFDTNIIIGEQGGNTFSYYTQKGATYVEFRGMALFHRTRMLNEMSKIAETPIIVNWDADVIVSPLQILEAAEKTRKGADVVYPYGGEFLRVPRTWLPTLKKLDIGIVKNTSFPGADKVSDGGAVFFKKSSFISGGMENEKFISFGAEDRERKVRFTKLGYRVERVNGPLYHINHYVGVNSSTRNPYWSQNKREFEKVEDMNKYELMQYIESWT